MNRIKLEDFTPYQNSLKWKINQEYYKKRGALAWLSGEIPYVITSNYQFAHQKAKVIIESLKSYESELGDQIKIIEIGSGGGLFAFNFIKAFKDLCIKENKEYFYDKLHYMFTDYSQKNLEDASENPFLIRLKKEGKLDFYLLNALATKKIKTIDGKSILLSKDSIDAAICSYVYCTLPTAIIKKENNKYFEKQTELYLKSNKNIEEITINKIISNVAENDTIENLEEEYYYKEIDLNEYIIDNNERNSFIKLSKNFDNALVEYSHGNIKNLREMLSYLKRNSVFLVSDKGIVNRDFFDSREDYFFSKHKNSIAHSVNFPFIEEYIKEINAKSICRKNENDLLHSILITKNLVSSVEEVFKKEFVENNNNEKVNKSIKELYDDTPDKLIKTIEFYLEVLDYRKKDPTVYYYLSKAYILNNEPDKVLELLEEVPEDFFSSYDFDFEKAEAYKLKGNYEEALFYYKKSLIKFGSHDKTYNNISNLHYKLKNYKESYINYKKAIISSKDTKVIENNNIFQNDDIELFELEEIEIDSPKELFDNAIALISEYISNNKDLTLLVKATINLSSAILKDPMNTNYYELLVKVYNLIGNKKKEEEIKKILNNLIELSKYSIK